MKIALVTYQDKGAYATVDVDSEDDQLITFLRSKGVEIEKQIWNDASVNWERFDLAILKSPWDYFDLINDFYDWLAMISNKNIRLLNPVDFVKWNADKHYLLDIEKAGLNVTPSIFIAKGNDFEAEKYLREFKTGKYILKPAISGGSKNTFKVTAANVAEVNTKITNLLAQEDFIIQPFLKEIEENGEWSLIYFNGKFSHALIKIAVAGEFRVQPMFGGTVHPQEPSDDMLNTTQKYIDQFAKDCLYARVDGVVVNGNFILMELELIEPFLFLNTNPRGFENYYQALLKFI